MSPVRRFAGTLLALLALSGAGLMWWFTRPRPAIELGPDAIFQFEKEQVVGFTVVRPDDTLSVHRDGEKWVTEGQPWRPSASMVRRVAHQLHDLTARAKVADAPDDLALYGLGPDAIRVELILDDGRTLAFAVGDPNPTSVSWYLRPLPDGPVYVVKKAAVDYYRLDAEAFREDRVGYFDAADCEAISATVDGRSLGFRRVDSKHWVMTEPASWPADRDRVRRILGAVAALRAERFVADEPADRTLWGLGEGADRLTLSLSSGEPVTLELGAPVADTDPPRIYAWRAEDDAVYEVRASVVEPLTQPLEAYRNPRVVGRHGWEVRAIEVEAGGQSVTLHATADTWRWEDGGEVAGATPRRVADAAADLRALDFHDVPPSGSGLDEPSARITLEFEEGPPVTVLLGARYDVPGPERPVGRQYAQLADSALVYTVDEALDGRIADLLREASRREAREEERRR